MSDLITRYEEKKDLLIKSLPKGTNKNSFMIAVERTIRNLKDPERVDWVTLYEAITTLANVGLNPNKALGQAFLLPFENGQTKKIDIQLIIGYKGYVSLAARKDVYIITELVHKEDHFVKQVANLQQPFIHQSCGKPVKTPDDMMGAYCIFHKNGQIIGREFLYTSEILKRRDKSKTYKNWDKYGRKGETPWEHDFPDMAKKTMVRYTSKMSAIFEEYVELIEKDSDFEEKEINPIQTESLPSNDHYLKELERQMQIDKSQAMEFWMKSMETLPSDVYEKGLAMLEGDK